ncbi:mitochondrial ribosomal protein L23 [Roridomyces roridus]|uniref:Large ribosomal subunit protein uL23m n=1 Tax=Roridomyces roridus TaxID=1738132 RepID=A0AAD7BJL6_9AGAR|nr:mitochondrial ribosomal protein L23 [Roridomyces roridus]
MFRRTVARLYASSSKSPPAAAPAASSSTSPAPTHGRWGVGRPHVHNPLYRKQASLSQARSRPLAVRLRRAQRYAQQIGLPPSTDKKPTQRLTLNKFLRNDEEKPKAIHIPRIRGMTVAYHKGKPYTVKVEGQKVYLPNLIFRLVRNYTPPGEPYNPWQATFRVPKNLTKTDIRGYLMAVYGVQTTFIRTDNYRVELSRRSIRDAGPDKRPSTASYKRAIVGLVEPFYYPLRLEDMPADRREEREAEIEDKLGVKMHLDLHKLSAQNQILVQNMPKHQARSSYWLNDVRPSRAKVIKQAAEHRIRRESLIEQQAEKWRQQRAAGEPISVNGATKKTDVSNVV